MSQEMEKDNRIQDIKSREWITQRKRERQVKDLEKAKIITSHIY